MDLSSTPIHRLYLAATRRIGDHRGSFARLFCDVQLAAALEGRKIVQINHSRTLAKGAIRGMHFQYPPHAELKCVRCLRGRVWDVAVDLRNGSPTFLQWYAEELSAENERMMIIPEGCAHGFQVLEPESELLYLHTAPYTPRAEGAVSYRDPRLSIRWPLEITDVSIRDQQHPLLTDDFCGIESC